MESDQSCGVINIVALVLIFYKMVMCFKVVL